MHRRDRFTFITGLMTVAVTISLAVSSASATDNHHQKAARTHRVHHAYAVAAAPNAIRMPGYVFVPGRGILGEACNLPTSTCPNSERDVQ